MSKATHHIPAGQRSVTPHLVVNDALEAIAFYQKAFGAELRLRMPGATPDRTIHAELLIGDSAVFLTDMTGPTPVKPPKGVTTCLVHLFVPDADKLVAQAVAAGANVIMPVMDMPWGDRYGQIQDPFGHCWSVATHKEDLTPAELVERTRSMFQQAQG